MSTTNPDAFRSRRREYMREWRSKRLADGQCPQCGDSLAVSRSGKTLSLCGPCLDEAARRRQR